MPKMTMTVKYVNQPKEGKTRGSIKGTDESFLGCPQNKLDLFAPGKTYDIEFTENGEWKTVTSAKEIVADKPSPAATAASPTPAGNGYYRPTAPADSLRMFVCANLTAMIRAGKVENTKEDLWATTQRLKAIYDHTFGDGNTFYASEAGQRAARG
jgi:hypothetical protein